MKVICGFTIPITMYGLPPSIDDLLKCMEQVKARGFGELELEIEAGNKEYVDRWDEVVEKSKEIDLKIPSIMAVSYEMFSLSKKLQDASIQYFDQSCEMNRRIGSSLATICFYLPPELMPDDRTELYKGGPPITFKAPEGFTWESFREIVVRQLSRCADIADKYGLDFAIELRAGDFMSSVDGLIGLFEDCGKSNMGVVFDCAHIHATKEYLEMALLKFGKKYLKLIHLSDNDGTQAYHLIPGKGNIDFEKIIGRLKLLGYEGHIVTDISGVPNILDEAVAMRDMLEELIG
jgi:sugar phosphate isomerase/epimerase